MDVLAIDFRHGRVHEACAV